MKIVVCVKRSALMKQRFKTLRGSTYSYRIEIPRVNGWLLWGSIARDDPAQVLRKKCIMLGRMIRTNVDVVEWEKMWQQCDSWGLVMLTMICDLRRDLRHRSFKFSTTMCSILDHPEYHFIEASSSLRWIIHSTVLLRTIHATLDQPWIDGPIYLFDVSPPNFILAFIVQTSLTLQVRGHLRTATLGLWCISTVVPFSSDTSRTSS